jgi:hypothetical protein
MIVFANIESLISNFFKNLANSHKKRYFDKVIKFCILCFFRKIMLLSRTVKAKTFIFPEFCLRQI